MEKKSPLINEQGATLLLRRGGTLVHFLLICSLFHVIITAWSVGVWIWNVKWKGWIDGRGRKTLQRQHYYAGMCHGNDTVCVNSLENNLHWQEGRGCIRRRTSSSFSTSTTLGIQDEMDLVGNAHRHLWNLAKIKEGFSRTRSSLPLGYPQLPVISFFRPPRVKNRSPVVLIALRISHASSM